MLCTKLRVSKNVSIRCNINDCVPSDFFLKKTPTQLFLCEICEIWKNIYSFKLDLVGLTVFPNLNLRLAKIKLFTKVCISKFSLFCRYASSFGVRKLY